MGHIAIMSAGLLASKVDDGGTEEVGRVAMSARLWLASRVGGEGTTGEMGCVGMSAWLLTS